MDEQIYIELGKFVENFNQLENWVIFWIGQLLGFEPQQAHIKVDLICKHMTYQQEIDLLRSLVVQFLDPEKAKKFKKVYSQLCSCGEIRNDLLHSELYINYGNTESGIPISSRKLNRGKAVIKGKPIDYNSAEEKIDSEKISKLNMQVKLAFRELIGFRYGQK